MDSTVKEPNAPQIRNVGPSSKKYPKEKEKRVKIEHAESIGVNYNSLLEQWSTVAAWHGIADAHLARTAFWKVMWVLVVAVTMMMGLNQCISMIMDFVKEDRWTSSISSRQVSSLPLPTMLVCSLNIFNQSALTQHGLTATAVVENAGSNGNVDPKALEVFQSETKESKKRTPTASPSFNPAPFQYPQPNVFPNVQNGPMGGIGQGQNGFPLIPNGYGQQGAGPLASVGQGENAFPSLPNAYESQAEAFGQQSPYVRPGFQSVVDVASRISNGEMGGVAEQGPVGSTGQMGTGSIRPIGQAGGAVWPNVNHGSVPGSSGRSQGGYWPEPSGMNTRGRNGFGTGMGDSPAEQGPVGSTGQLGTGSIRPIGQAGGAVWPNVNHGTVPGPSGQSQGGYWPEPSAMNTGRNGFGPGMGDNPGAGGMSQNGAMPGGMNGPMGRGKRQTGVATARSSNTSTVDTTKPVEGALGDKQRMLGNWSWTDGNTSTPLTEQNYDILFGIMESSTFQCVSTVIGCGAGTQLTWNSAHSADEILTDKCCQGSKLDEDYCFMVNLAWPFNSMLNHEGRVHTANSENTIFVLMDPRLGDYFEELVATERPGQGFRLHFGVGDDAKYYSKPILISPGSYNLIELTLEERSTVFSRERGITSLLRPTPPCRYQANYSYVNIETYEKWACEADCHIRREMEICDCTTLEGEFRPDEIYCKNVTHRTLCKKVVMSEKDDPESEYHRCKMQCNESCHWQSISSVASSTIFPAPAKIDSLRRFLNDNGKGYNFTEDDVKRLALVEVYYGSMTVRLIERSERVTLNELISNIGGALGAWAGISLITIYQAFVYITMGCTSAMAGRRGRARVRAK